MNDTNIKSCCNSSTHYYTLQEQDSLLNIERQLLSRQTISKTSPTYVHFPVQLEPHWAAVQIIITPFTLRSIPAQTFYRSSYHYTLCCDSANPSAICSIVQRTYDIRYHPIQWDFSSEYCCITDAAGLEPSQNGDCATVINAKLCQYMAVASRSAAKTIDVGDSDIEDVAATSSLKRPQGSSMDDVNKGSARENKRQRLNPSSSNNSFDAGDGRREGDGGDAAEDGGCDVDSGDDVGFAAKITTKIRSGMKCCSVFGVDPITDVQLNDDLTVYDLATHFATQCWTQASKFTEDAKEKSWILRYLACCYVLFLSPTELSLMDQCRESTGGKKLMENHWEIDRWRSTAYMANLIVDGLSKRWQWKAGLIYHAIAAKNYRFGKSAKLSRGRQQKIATFVVEQLSDDEPPDGQIQRPLLHPAYFISETLHVEYSRVCHLMGLESYAKIKTQPSLEVADGRNSIMGIWQTSKLQAQTVAVGCSLHTEGIREMRQGEGGVRTLAAATQVGLPVENQIYPEASAANLDLTSQADQSILGRQCLASGHLNPESQTTQGSSEKFPLDITPSNPYQLDVNEHLEQLEQEQEHLRQLDFALLLQNLDPLSLEEQFQAAPQLTPTAFEQQAC